MIIVMRSGAPAEEISRISKEVEADGLEAEKIIGEHKVVIGLVGDTASLDPAQFKDISPWIEQVLRVEKPFKRVSRDYRHGEASTVEIPTGNGVISVGENHPVAVVAGPCSVENEGMIVDIAQRV